LAAGISCNAADGRNNQHTSFFCAGGHASTSAMRQVLDNVLNAHVNVVEKHEDMQLAGVLSNIHLYRMQIELPSHIANAV